MTARPHEAKQMLDLSARLALRAWGNVEPNPLVGAVIVRDGTIIGMGHHTRFGEMHAERMAINDCIARGNDPRGATCYVTLEPCTHMGKQPPCTEAIINAGIAHVVYACADPHNLAAGGANILHAAGIHVQQSAESELACAISEPFRKRVITGLPWVTAKWAQTIDGRIATRTGSSKWISCPQSRARVHRWRARTDAILCGLGTVAVDDPQLTARDVPRVRRVATRVVADANLDIPLQCNLVQSAREIPTILACDAASAEAGINASKREQLESTGVIVLPVKPKHAPSVTFAKPGGSFVDMHEMLRQLWDQHSIASVLVESGAGLLGSLIEADLIDEALVYIAPLLLGDDLARSVATGRVADSLSAGRKFELRRVKQIGTDVELLFRRPRTQADAARLHA
ncbi:MAG: bifunctional diaminohydroxyphosphoribosylaminopyrimidine deaminase/5-amino-6-(5-phosphoribosylamino)uracil reductase RibD [Phycisphaeraceae bacterium]|nr:bifunctional diaminohydroxyphosphoribosylaminopyrimidine deaminase/5-amino-6-(5-phosphoribosylamino)uracil reductase RibD [Phycisphaerales bacterium]MCB9859337.1 bifunctional diaminohydroxyphosphoribosylaminopyrimidine deaminase/5-amino-6-(5-phosphoribosylamino)uracil reductase RibD [Phycisphaeraceae bacterium]